MSYVCCFIISLFTLRQQNENSQQHCQYIHMHYQNIPLCSMLPTVANILYMLLYNTYKKGKINFGIIIIIINMFMKD